MTYWLLLMTVVCAIVYWLWQYRNRFKPASRIAAARDSSAYHSVSIVHGDRPCAAVRRLKGMRFLPTEAPVLRLQGCTADSCQCRYVHYDDRREDERRNHYGRYRSIPPDYVTQERRTTSGRRNADRVELDEIGYHTLHR